MRQLILSLLAMLFCLSCEAQDKMSLRYLGYEYSSTKNESFINRELKFLRGKDTISMNVKIPIDHKTGNVVDRGVFYDCKLEEGKAYDFTLKRICVSDIPVEYNSYYKINAIQDDKDCSKFTEQEQNTAYEYKGNYGKYVDISGVLYEINGLNPDKDCFLPH